MASAVIRWNTSQCKQVRFSGSDVVVCYVWNVHICASPEEESLHRSNKDNNKTGHEKVNSHGIRSENTQWPQIVSLLWELTQDGEEFFFFLSEHHGCDFWQCGYKNSFVLCSLTIWILFDDSTLNMGLSALLIIDKHSSKSETENVALYRSGFFFLLWPVQKPCL